LFERKLRKLYQLIQARTRPFGVLTAALAPRQWVAPIRAEGNRHLSIRPEPDIQVRTREDVLYLLAEAAEIEHNLMCCYLYAAFGLKRAGDDGLSAQDAALIAKWRAAIMSVAIEEMTHLTLVANLTASLGGRPHFGRPNFPVAPLYHPAGIVVRLAPFNMDTLDHFIFLERPEGSDLADSPAFASPMNYERVVPKRRVMPSSQDYATVGHLYRGIRSGLDYLAKEMGEKALFVCEPLHQVGPSAASLPGLCIVTDLAGAHAAIDTIVDQGEGATEHRDDAHFSRFLEIRREFAAKLAVDPTFSPSRPVATNPVMRKPMDASDRVYIDAPLSAAVVDLANALYGQMLRFLVQAFGRAQLTVGDQALLVDGAVDMMRCMVPVAEALTSLPASASRPGVNAGMTFAMLRNLAPAIEGVSEWKAFSERVGQLAHAAAELAPELPPLGLVAERLRAVAEQLNGRRHATASAGQAILLKETERMPTTSDVTSSTNEDGVEIVRGKALTIKFNGKRCIHSRFCVLWQPHVYKANVVGAWIDPDADSAEASVAVAHNCPSGAIQYERHDGGPAESAPRVNLINLRENGPLAVRADILVKGASIGTRATLCRCGASKNKPFCDGSHVAAGFQASGEPKTIEAPVLGVRNGPLEITPQPNGPLRVRGNLEICSGTGRTVKRTQGEMLCRCGHSQNKPFCDGSHAKVGFQAD
jgi:CDGSH-type Zn-finger protein/uncharacterized Fe-S cluster protein YjdI